MDNQDIENQKSQIAQKLLEAWAFHGFSRVSDAKTEVLSDPTWDAYMVDEVHNRLIETNQFEIFETRFGKLTEMSTQDPYGEAPDMNEHCMVCGTRLAQALDLELDCLHTTELKQPLEEEFGEVLDEGEIQVLAYVLANSIQVDIEDGESVRELIEDGYEHFYLINVEDPIALFTRIPEINDYIM